MEIPKKYQYINICKIIEYTFCESLEKMCHQTQMPVNFVIFFSDIDQFFQPAQTKSLEKQKFG